MGYLKVTVSAIVGKDFNNGKLTFTIRDCDADKRWNVIKIADVSFAEFMKAYEGVSQDDIKKWFLHDCCELRHFLSTNNISYKALGKWGNKYIPYSEQLLCRRMNHTFKNWGNKELCKEEKARLFGDAEDADKKYLEYLLEELNSIVEKTNTTGVIG